MSLIVTVIGVGVTPMLRDIPHFLDGYLPFGQGSAFSADSQIWPVCVVERYATSREVSRIAPGGLAVVQMLAVRHGLALPVVDRCPSCCCDRPSQRCRSSGGSSRTPIGRLEMGRMEIIARTERRRRYSPSERTAVLVEADEPGVTVCPRRVLGRARSNDAALVRPSRSPSWRSEGSQGQVWRDV